MKMELKNFSFKIFGALFFALFLLALLLGPLNQAQAAVPTNPVTILLQSFNTSAQITGLNVAWNFKNFNLNVFFVSITKAVIAYLRDWVINFIATGQFGRPQFTSSFFADPSRWAENAARLFLSQLTGINFCNYNLGVRPNLNINIRLNFDLKCNVQNFQALTNQLIATPWTIPFVEEYLLVEESDPVYDMFLTAEEKKKAENLALNSRGKEVEAGSGFLGLKDPATGKIITPGDMIAKELGEQIGSDYRDCDSASEFQQVLGSCALQAVAQIINAGIGRGIQGALGAAFPP